MKEIEGGKRWTRGSGTYIAVLKAEIAHLKGKSIEDFVDETDDDDFNTDEKNNDI